MKLLLICVVLVSLTFYYCESIGTNKRQAELKDDIKKRTEELKAKIDALQEKLKSLNKSDLGKGLDLVVVVLNSIESQVSSIDTDSFLGQILLNQMDTSLKNLDDQIRKEEERIMKLINE